MPLWKDTTTRSRGQENSPATVWTYDNKILRVTVVSGHIYYPNEWIMHCHSLGFDTFRMKLDSSAPAEQAQETALHIVRNRLTAILNSLPE